MTNENKKPQAVLSGFDSNVFNLIGIASRALKDHGLKDEAEEMQRRVMNAASFDEAICIILEYVDAQ